MKEYVTYEEVTEAYFDCRKHKRTKLSALAYEVRYEENNYKLWKELNEGSYEIGPSICFCVTKPKLREVFAADFRDRVVHHLLMRKMLPIFENNFILDTYSCRTGKGVLFGIKRIQEQAKEIGPNCWFAKVDVSGFFMSIDKDILWQYTEKLLRENWEGNDVDWWISLLKKVIFNRPELNCVKKGNPLLWEGLSENKTLFKTKGKGLPIGNLTSQILANTYMDIVDKKLKRLTLGYGRYVDDIVALDTSRKKLHAFVSTCRNELKKIGLKINEKKTIIQRADKGILFTGYIIQPFGIYPSGRMRKNALKVSKNKNENIEHLVQRINSYCGFLRHALTYDLRFQMFLNFLTNYGGTGRTYAKEHINSIRIIKRK